MNTFFICGMFERLLREWMGYGGRLNKISNLRMTAGSAGPLECIRAWSDHNGTSHGNAANGIIVQI
jgi:hypothetical protein